MGVFQEAIKRIVKVRRWVDKTNLEHLQDNNFMSTIADNVVISLTLAINDLAKLDKVMELDKTKENENVETKELQEY